MDETMQSIIKNKFLEELNDVSKYLELCKMTNDECNKQVFRDIAKEEMTHAEFLKNIIHKNNFKVTDAEHKDAQELYKKAKEELHSV